MPRKMSKTQQRNVALCYVRLSWTKDESDANSPERQRANIELVCQEHGWQPEWYEDTEGHKSGTKEKNRPGWLALKARLSDLDVVALVANDLSRLHRKGWRVGDLLDFVDEHDVRLVLAAPGKQMDFATATGRILAQLSAIFDEWYAVDIAQRSRDSIQHRKRSGKTVGLPPFGTVRAAQTGYLIPSNEGAWRLPDGIFAQGTPETSPGAGAVWCSYYQVAERILQLYAQGQLGTDAIAYQMQVEGLPFRDRQGEPTPMEGDDVRRVVANWMEYGGCVTEQRARERHPFDHPLEQIQLNAERAVFPLELLYQVGQVRLERTMKHSTDDGQKLEDYPYPLNGITYCHHCEQLAQRHNNPKLRSRLGGKGKDRHGRYRHRAGVLCGCTNRSVKRDIYEADFQRLLNLLTVDAQQLELLTELSLHALPGQQNEQDMQLEKEKAVAKCRRRLEAARHLYEDGDLSREEYLRRKEQNEREMLHWQARTAESEQVALELALCVEAVHKITTLWQMSDDEDRQGMARNLFSSISYNLDTQRIEDFRLKPWADRFVILRAALYEVTDRNKNTSEETSEVGTGVTPTGFEPVYSP